MNEPIRKMLDFGAGQGPAAYAFSDIFPDYHQIFAVEPNLAMKKMGEHLTQDLKRVTWLNSLSEGFAF